MSALSKTDVGELTKELNETLQATESSATPRRLDQLLTRLEEETKDVQRARIKYEVLGIPSLPSGEVWLPQGEGLSSLQWSLDMAAWQIRLARYRDHLDDIDKDEWDTDMGVQLAYKYITAPLLDGIYYEELPGIVLNDEEKARMRSGEGYPQTDIAGDHPPGNSNPKPPDVISPFTLGNQIIVYQESMKQAFERFVDEMKNPPLFKPKTWPTWGKAVAIGSVAFTAGVGIWAVRQRYKRKVGAIHAIARFAKGGNLIDDK